MIFLEFLLICLFERMIFEIIYFYCGKIQSCGQML